MLDHAALFALLDTAERPRRLLIGYSGGLDSHALLHWLVQQRALLADRGHTLSAMHIDHGLQPASADWGKHCDKICANLGVSLKKLTVNATAAAGESPEAAARAARYQAFAAHLDADAAVLTGQHRDDQAETLLLALLRGAGPSGLAAMPAHRRLGDGWLLRPLLTLDRATLIDYARTHRLSWIDDPSNANTRYDRNYLRHQVMPQLRARWPAVSTTLARSANLCRDAATQLSAQADDDILTIYKNLDLPANQLDWLPLQGLQQLPIQRQRHLLRRWLQQRFPQRPPLSSTQLQRLQHEVIGAATDRQPLLQLPGLELRRFRQRLYALAPLLPLAVTTPLVWPDWHHPLPLPPLGKLVLRRRQSGGLCARQLIDLSVRFRCGGERLQPQYQGRGRHQQRPRALKQLLSDADIAPWQRDRLPLLYAGTRLVAVAGLWHEQQATAAVGHPGYIFTWLDAH